MTDPMVDIRFYYQKKVKELKEAEMNERSTIKAGMIAQSYGDYYKGITSDLNAVLEGATNAMERQERLFKAHPKTYDGNKIKALQDSINNIQEYKEKLNNQYIK
jgi:superoxide dismutase